MTTGKISLSCRKRSRPNSTWAPLVVFTICIAGDVVNAQSGRGSGVTRRDSAGVQLVDVRGSVLDSLPLWRIGADPIVSIGNAEGAAPYLFTGMPGAAALPGGKVAIPDANGTQGSGEIRIFDSTGKFIRQFGRFGQGPGEFRSSPKPRAGNNGQIVTEAENRVIIFDSLGKVLSTWDHDPRRCGERACGSRGVLSNGTLVTYVSERTSLVDLSMAGRTITGLRAFYWSATATGVRPAMTLTLPPHKVLVRPAQTPRGAGRGLPQNALVLPPVLERAPELAIVAGFRHFAVTQFDPPTIHIFDDAGVHRRSIRIVRPAVAITNAEKQELINRQNASINIPGRVVRDTWPPFGVVRFAENDDIWVWDYDKPNGGADTQPATVTIFAIDGTPVARLHLRGDPIWRGHSVFNETQSSRDVYRVIARDSLDVSKMLAFRILKQ